MTIGADIRTHLTDAEFSRLLDGAQPGAAVEAHLLSCAACREELDAVQGAVGNFCALSTAWAEVEAPRRVPVPASWFKGVHLQTSWGAGLAATAVTSLLAFWLGVPGQLGTLRLHRTVAHVAVAVPSNTELATDNSLLLSIDQELSEPGQPEVSAEQLQVTARHNESRPAGTLTD